MTGDNGTSPISLDKLWTLDSFEAFPANAQGFFPLELNFINMKSQEHRKVILAMEIGLFRQLIMDFEDLMLHQEESMRRQQQIPGN